MNKFIAAAFGSLVAAPAFAGGPVAPAIEPVPVVMSPSADWTGGYIGVQLGYGDVGSSDELDGNGALGGVHAGYLFDFGNWIAGAELDYDLAHIDLAPGDNSLDSVARLKLKAGADMGNAFVYATAGGAYAEATVDGAGLNDTGYFGGIGMDYMVSDNWSVGGEVLVHRFDNFDDSGVDIDATTAMIRASFRF